MKRCGVDGRSSGSGTGLFCFVTRNRYGDDDDDGDDFGEGCWHCQVKWPLGKRKVSLTQKREKNQPTFPAARAGPPRAPLWIVYASVASVPLTQKSNLVGRERERKWIDIQPEKRRRRRVFPFSCVMMMVREIERGHSTLFLNERTISGRISLSLSCCLLSFSTTTLPHVCRSP